MSSLNSKSTVLLVEDDLPIALLYKTKLELEGYKVLTAHNGLEALRTVKHIKPDLVLLDLKMPIMNGEEFLDKFRKIAEFKETPVIILTNISRSEAPKTLWHNGINGYFVKAHHTPNELINIIEEILI